MKTGKLLLAMAVVALAVSGSQAQTYKTNFATKIVLAGGGVDPVHTVTLTTAAPGASAITLTFPTSLPIPAGTYMLTTDNTGALSWINPATGISMAGDVTGTAGASVVSAINGAPLGSTTPTAGHILIGSGTTWVTKALGGDATLGSDGTLTLANSSGARSDLGLGSIATQDAGAVNITGGTIGGSTSVNTSGTITGGAITANGAVNLDAAPNTGGTNNIGNATSTTNFYGTVSFPAGSVTASSLGLAHNNILVGDNSGHAAAYGPATNSVLITDNVAGGTPQWSTTLPSGLTIPSPSISNPTLTGTLTLPTNSVATSSIAHGAANTFLTTANDGTTVAFTGLNVGASLSGNGVNTALNLALGNTNTWTVAQNFNGGIASTGANDLALTSPTGQAIDLNTTNANPINIATGSNANAIDIGNGNGSSGTYSTTTFAGLVNFTGAVSFPAGSVTASSLGLSDGKILIGDISNHAAAQTTSQDVTITDAGVATVHGSHAATFSATGNISATGSVSGAGVTSTSGLTTSGGTANINTTDASNVNVGTGSNTNTIDIGNGNGSSGTYSTTNLAGLVNLTGTVSFTNAPTLPAGSVPNAALAHSTIGTTSSNSSLNVPGTMTLGDASDNFTLNTGHTNTWSVAQNFNGGIASTGANDLALTSPTGQAIDLNTTNANPINIATGSNANAIDIGNGNGSSGTYSTTTFAGLVNFTGAVSFPAGSVTASSLGLSDGKILIGDISNHAAAQTMSQDVTITDAGVATTNGSHAATFAVVNNATVGGTLGVTGQTSLGSTVLTNGGTTSFSTDQTDITPGTSNSYFFISNTDGAASHTVGGISGGLTTGRVIELINSGANPIVLLNQSTGSVGTQFSIPGGNAIMAAGGSATFIYDGTYWHLTATE